MANRQLQFVGSFVLALGLTGALGAGVAGAASNASHPNADPHEFKATLTVTGFVKKSETFTENLSVLPSCSVLATGHLPHQKGPREWSLPAGGSASFSLTWNISHGYVGPGTYTKLADFQGSVELDAVSQQFTPVSGSVVSVTVKPNGSGKATFKNLQNYYTQALGRDLVSGSETWTCS
jgi:hypothetical protein